MGPEAEMSFTLIERARSIQCKRLKLRYNAHFVKNGGATCSLTFFKISLRSNAPHFLEKFFSVTCTTLFWGGLKGCNSGHSLAVFPHPSFAKCAEQVVDYFKDTDQAKAHTKAQKASSVGHKGDYWYFLVAQYSRYNRVLNVHVDHRQIFLGILKNILF